MCTDVTVVIAQVEVMYPVYGAKMQKVGTIRQIDFDNFTFLWSDAQPPEDVDQPWHWFTSAPDSTGGTFNWDYLYVYKLESGKPQLLARM